MNPPPPQKKRGGVGSEWGFFGGFHLLLLLDETFKQRIYCNTVRTTSSMNLQFYFETLNYAYQVHENIMYSHKFYKNKLKC